jgi:DNA polymerase
MIIRLIYDPKNTWECHRFDVDDFTLFGALSKIDAPKDLSDGDIVVSGNFSFYEHQDKQLKVIPNPIPTIQQNPHECNLCNLHKRVIRVGVPSEIHKKNPTILIVGMAPGREEDIENRPFVESAPAASIIREMVYEKLKLDRTEVAWTNIARCFPTDEQGNMRDPEMEEMLACSGKFLWNEIREIDPKVIVVVGNVAAGFLLNDPKLAITKVRGKIYKLKIGDKDYAVIPSIHPSAIARGQRQYYPMLLSDLVTAKSIGSTDVVMPRWTLVNDTKGVINVLKKIQVLYRAGLIDSVALDIESDQIHLEDNSKVIDKAIWQEEHSIVGTGLSWDENFGFFLAHYHPESKVDIEEVLPYYKEVLSEVPIRAQNAKYDQSWWLAKHGIDTILKHDTMLASFAYHGQSRSHGLKGLLASYFGWPPYDYDLGVMINLLPPDQRSFRNINLTKIAEYCCYDAIGTWKLSEHQIKYELFDKTKELFELLCRTSDTLRYAELYGAPIDLERLSRDEKRYEEENASDYENLVKVPIVQTYLDLKKKYTKDDKFSPASPNDLRSVIFGAYYCPDCQHYTYSRARGEKGRINPKTKSCLKCGSFNIERIIGLGIDPDEKQGYTDTGLPSTSQDNIDEIAKTYAHKHIASTESLIDGKFNCKLCKKLVEVDENFHVNPGFEDEVKVLQYINRIRKRNKLQGFFEGLHTFLKPVINESDQIGELIYN